MKKIFFIIPALLIVLASCNKKEAAQLNFDAKTEKASYKVGEPVNFILTGNPEQLTFFSGLNGHKYVYKDRTEATSDVITLEIATNRRYGSDAQQPKSFRVLASQKFDGNYVATSINEATDWLDITEAFTLSGIQPNDNYVASGAVNLKSLAALNLDTAKPIYFAFKYTGVTGSTQPRWWVNKFDIKTTTTDGESLTVTNIAGAGFKQIKVLPESPVNWIFGTDNTAKFAGGGGTVGSNQVWAVTSALKLTSVTPDVGEPLKNMSTRFDNYEFIYTTPGKYSVTFVAANINVYGERTTVKTVEVTVLP